MYINVTKVEIGNKKTTSQALVLTQELQKQNPKQDQALNLKQNLALDLKQGQVLNRKTIPNKGLDQWNNNIKTEIEETTTINVKDPPHQEEIEADLMGVVDLHLVEVAEEEEGKLTLK